MTNFPTGTEMLKIMRENTQSLMIEQETNLDLMFKI